MDLNLVAPINKLSYGIVSSNLLHSLLKLGVRVSLFPINPCNIEADLYLHESIKIGLKNAGDINLNAPCVRIFHQFDMSQWAGMGKHIGFPIFELDTFNAREKYHLSACDGLIVCSQWAKQIVINEIQNKGAIKIGASYNYDPVKVVPLGVDTEIFSNTMPNPRKTCVFLNIGKWEVRKGHDILVHLFNRAFKPEDDVELWMMNHNLFMKPEDKENNSTWQKLYAESQLGDKIKFIPRVNTLNEVADIMSRSDCGIFPSRAEGWNLELLEMMACGKMVIATNYSGHTEFCNSDNALLVDTKLTEPAFHAPWFHGQGNWALFGSDQHEKFIEHMQTVYVKKQRGDVMINRNGIETAKQFSWTHSAQKLMEAL